MQVNDIILKVKEGGIDDPVELSEYTTQLSAFLWQAGQNCLSAEIEYAKEWTEVRKNHASDKQTDFAMKQKDSYRAFEEAKLAQKTILEVIRALKHRQRALSDEWRNQ